MLKIGYINWWGGFDFENNFFIKFIREYIDPDTIFTNDCSEINILIAGVFGEPKKLHEKVDACSKSNNLRCIIFTTGENTEIPEKIHARYSDYQLSLVDLSLGFKLFEGNPKNLRFPLWLLSYSLDTTNLGLVDTKFNVLDGLTLKQYIKKSGMNKTKFCGVLHNHPGERGYRNTVFDILKKVNIEVDAPGKFRKNVGYSILQTDENNRTQSKIDWLKDYRFNMCGENTLGEGYVTEKIFDCLIGGCIPVYYGPKLTEPDILNQNLIVNIETIPEWTTGGLEARIRYIEENYEEFIDQPIFVEGGLDRIRKYYTDLEKKLKNILQANK